MASLSVFTVFVVLIRRMDRIDQYSGFDFRIESWMVRRICNHAYLLTASSILVEKHLNVVAVEGPFRMGRLLTVQHFHVVGSPAMFGTQIPSFGIFANEAQLRQNVSHFDGRENQNQTAMIDANMTEVEVDVLLTNLNHAPAVLLWM